MKALITGITGQDGAYLTKHLESLGYDVVGAVRRKSCGCSWRFQKLEIDPELVSMDLLDLGSIIRVLEQVGPDEVYNLAAQSQVGVSFEQPMVTAQITGLGCLNLLEGIRIVDPSIKFYQASSSEMFGNGPSPQNEETPFAPRSPYGVAKCFAHWTTLNYRDTYGIHTACGILFNHESPLRGTEFVTRKIVQAAVRGETVKLGNLNAMRDWGYAPDFVRGMHTMLQHGGEYVLATGKTTTVRRFAECAYNAVGHSPMIVSSSSLYRPLEVEALRGDYSKAKKKFGWEPTVYFKELAEIMVRDEDH